MLSTLFLRDLALTLLAYNALAFSYLGFGWLTSRLWSGTSPGSEKPFFLIWLGWSIVLLIFQILNIFVPINAISSILVLGIGIFPAFFFVRSALRNGRLRSVSSTWLVFMLITAILVATLAMQAPKAYDSGLYHFNSIRWTNESSIVLGLGNLHGRLAFNQSFFTFVASLNLYPLFKHGHNIANSFLMLLLLGECWLHFTSYLSSKHASLHFMPSHMVGMLIVPAVLYITFTPDLSSPVPDIASAVLQVVIFIHFLYHLEAHVQGEGTDSSLWFIFILSATAITVKISSAVFVFTICIILLIVQVNTWQLAAKQILFRIFRLLLIPSLIILIWGVRGMFLSGCPLYPSTLGCVKASWSIPKELIQEEASWIFSWARLPRAHPDTVLGSWNWLEPWFNSTILGNKASVLYPLGLSILLVGIILFRWVSDPAVKGFDKRWFLVLIPIFTGLLFWFFSAPDIRFVQALFWILPAASSMILIKMTASPERSLYGLIVVMFIVVNTSIGWSIIQDDQRFADIELQGYIPIRSVRLINQVTNSGLVILTPAKDDQCWNSELPCTPNFNADLNFQDNIVFPKFFLAVQD